MTGITHLCLDDVCPWHWLITCCTRIHPWPEAAKIQSPYIKLLEVIHRDDVGYVRESRERNAIGPKSLNVRSR